jgi:hypothetical protein
VKERLALLKQELAGPNPNPIERLLVDRVGACWLQLAYADTMEADFREGSFADGDYNQRKQDRAHRRFLSAVKMLATVRRLTLPIHVDLNVAGAVVTKQADPAPALRPWRLPVGTN